MNLASLNLCDGVCSNPGMMVQESLQELRFDRHSRDQREQLSLVLMSVERQGRDRDFSPLAQTRSGMTASAELTLARLTKTSR